MIIAEPINDVDLIAEVMTHPKIWPHISDDSSPEPENFTPAICDFIKYLGMYDDGEFIGLFMIHRHNAICWEVHTCLLPSAWGGRSLECAKICIEWAFENLGCERFITNVPSNNRLAMRLAKLAGMNQFGINEKSFLKDGILFDQVMLGISKR